jgi:hypothetical protein
MKEQTTYLFLFFCGNLTLYMFFYDLLVIGGHIRNDMKQKSLYANQPKPSH